MEYREVSINVIEEAIFFNKSYKGESKIYLATGKPADMLEQERIDDTPWSTVMDKSAVTTDKLFDEGTMVCAFKRDFETEFSNIPIKVDGTLKVMVGYKMFLDKEWHKPGAEGYSGDRLMEWLIIDTHAVTLLTAGTLAVVAALFSF